MRQTYSEYLRPSDQEIEDTWSKGLIVPDANVLLSLYRYTKETTDKLLSLFEILKERLWLPYQVGLEYNRNRLHVISQQSRAYQDALADVDKLSLFLTPMGERARGPHIKPELLGQIKGLLLRAQQDLERRRDDRAALGANDSIFDRVAEIFKGNIAPRPDAPELERRRNEASRRMDAGKPPGQQDKGKSGDRSLGDAIVWAELLAHAKGTNRDLIWITDDQKEDWWRIVDGKHIGLRPELLLEFSSLTGRRLLAFSTERFMVSAAKRLSKDVIEPAKAGLDDAITEIRNQAPRPIPPGYSLFDASTGERPDAFESVFHGPDGRYVRFVLDKSVDAAPAKSLVRAMDIASSPASQLNEASRVLAGFWGGWLLTGAVPSMSGSRSMSAYSQAGLRRLLETKWADLALERVSLGGDEASATHAEGGRQNTVREGFEQFLGPWDYSKYVGIADGRV